jgi:phosphate starvation-inducible protein PhoH
MLPVDEIQKHTERNTIEIAPLAYMRGRTLNNAFIILDEAWSQMFPDYRRVILKKLARSAGLDDLERRIVVEHALTPADIHRRYRVLDGAIYGIASHGRFFAPKKESNLFLYP